MTPIKPWRETHYVPSAMFCIALGIVLYLVVESFPFGPERALAAGATTIFLSGGAYALARFVFANFRAEKLNAKECEDALAARLKEKGIEAEVWSSAVDDGSLLVEAGARDGSRLTVRLRGRGLTWAVCTRVAVRYGNLSNFDEGLDIFKRDASSGKHLW